MTPGNKSLWAKEKQVKNSYYLNNRASIAASWPGATKKGVGVFRYSETIEKLLVEGKELYAGLNGDHLLMGWWIILI